VSQANVDRRLVEEFTDLGDDEPGNLQPELHVVGLSGQDVVAIVEHLNRLGARWDDRTFYLDSEGIDVTVSERPDVAALVVGGQADHACIGADGIEVDGVELPSVSMFIYPDSVEFFWDTGPPWTVRHVPAFLALMGQLLDLAPSAALRPDPAYTDAHRQLLGRIIGEATGRPDRIDYGDPWRPAG
jgi:hypothetical protein